MHLQIPSDQEMWKGVCILKPTGKDHENYEHPNWVSCLYAKLRFNQNGLKIQSLWSIDMLAAMLQREAYWQRNQKGVTDWINIVCSTYLPVMIRAHRWVANPVSLLRTLQQPRWVANEAVLMPNARLSLRNQKEMNGFTNILGRAAFNQLKASACRSRHEYFL